MAIDNRFGVGNRQSPTQCQHRPQQGKKDLVLHVVSGADKNKVTRRQNKITQKIKSRTENECHKRDMPWVRSPDASHWHATFFWYVRVRQLFLWLCGPSASPSPAGAGDAPHPTPFAVCVWLCPPHVPRGCPGIVACGWGRDGAGPSREPPPPTQMHPHRACFRMPGLWHPPPPCRSPHPVRTPLAPGMHWKGGRCAHPLPSRAPSQCPATVPLTPSGGANGVHNRQ